MSRAPVTESSLRPSEPEASPAVRNGRGLGWVVAQSVLMLASIALAILYPGDWTRLSWSIAGGVLFLLGAWFGLAGVARLGRNRTAFPKPQPGSVLVQDGIYGRVRHPLYTSVMLVAAGWALIWQSPPALVASLTLIPFFHAKARHEERLLLQAFSAYAAYALRVPRFIPRLFR